MTDELTAAPAVPASQAKPPAKVWDIVLTIILVLLGIGLVFALAFLPIFAAFAWPGCDTSCETQMNAGYFLGLLLAPALYVITVIWAIVRLVKRKVAFWVVLVGYVLAGAASAAGFAIVMNTMDAYVARM